MIDEGCDSEFATRIALDAHNFACAIDANALRHGDFGRQREGKLDGRFTGKSLMISEDEYSFGADIASSGDCM